MKTLLGLDSSGAEWIMPPKPNKIAPKQRGISVHNNNTDQELTFPPLTEFHLFPSLPPELRLEVWKHTCNEGRIVIVEIVADMIPTSDNISVFCSTLASATCVPALLHACSEAREAGLRIYDTLPIPEAPGRHDACKDTYVNWKQDIIYLRSDPANEEEDVWDGSGIFENIVAKKAHSIAFALRKFCGFDEDTNPYKVFERLEKIFVVIEGIPWNTRANFHALSCSLKGTVIDDQEGENTFIKEIIEWDSSCCLESIREGRDFIRTLPHLKVTLAHFDSSTHEHWSSSTSHQHAENLFNVE
ncbi:hypothetical protein BJ875DRAFT_471924 [Amylocarpus encephaloides]|uniref:2EXR domain-containing protein n=1 Tax=Amylocarpus encephaloides TaxID=45428 RepID=A0A9P7YC14_9HELO|nr:hypothetical protein BJ875DRAFT_471924 [Amylocarpus encephaloides]